MTSIENIRNFPDRFRTALAFVTEPVAILDRRRNILYFNPAFERRFESLASQGVGRSLDEVLPPAMNEILHDQLFHMEKDPNSRDFFLNHGMRDYRVSISPIMFNNKHAGSILMFHNISSEKTTARFNKRILNALMDDIQRPLNEISLLLGQPSQSAEKSNELMDRGEKVFRGLVDDLNDLMDFCSLILEEEVVQRSTFSPQKLLNLTLRSLRPRARAKGIHLEELSQNDLPDVIGDQAKISRIIILVSDYFLKQTPKGELICLSSELKRSLPLSHLLYSVTATGIVRARMDQDGIAQRDSKDSSKITHEDKVASRRLFLMQRLVLAMEGTWATAAQEGLGTTMTVSIPVETAEMS